MGALALQLEPGHPRVACAKVDGMNAHSPDLDPVVLSQLTSLRKSIDNVDAALIHLLAERFKFTQAVGQLKAEHNLPPSDPDREKRQVERLRTLAVEANLDPEFAEKWFNFVVEQVIKHHVEIAREN